MTTRDAHRVVIAGGGIAGLEALLALRALAGGAVHLTLVTDRARISDRPATVVEPFDRGIARAHDVQAIAADQGAEVLFDRLASVPRDEQAAVLASGVVLPYEALVVATGATLVGAVPGAVTFRGAGDVPAMRAVVEAVRSGAARSIAFVLPSESSWPVPLYELAMMTGAELVGAGVTGARVRIVTPESAPLALFGPRAAEALMPLLADRRVEVVTGARATAAREGRVVLADGRTLLADRAVAVAMARGRSIPGVPTDDAGFIGVDAHGRVPGRPGVYAAGDATAFPLKQGGLAAQQADAVAETIAAELGLVAEPQPFRPVVRGMLLVGGSPLYLRAEVGAGEGSAEPVATASAASAQALWWPPAKVAAPYLGPYLSTARPRLAPAPTIADRSQPAGTVARGHEDALELVLLMADGDARWGDYRAAIRALEAAEALHGPLPPEYERKREQWLAQR